MRLNGEDIGYIDVRNFIGSIYDDTMHSKRIDSIANAALGVIASSSLIIHRVGISLASARGLHDKHAIKQVDRLLSNKKLKPDDFFPEWVSFVIGSRPSIKVAMDWTEFHDDKHTTLMLSLITNHGRATPLMWKTFSTKTLKDNRNNYEDELLFAFKDLIPEGINVTIVADRGFCDIKLFEFLVSDLGFNYIIRFRSNFIVEDLKGNRKSASEWVPKNGKTKTIRNAKITAKDYQVGTAVCVKEKGMKQAWCIACSDESISGSETVRWYGKRWGCEPQFRDTKDLHFGMGLSETHVRSTSKRDRILFIAALSISLLTLLGAAGEKIGMDRYLKANTVKHRTMSLFRQGCCYFRKLANLNREQAIELINAFNKILYEHKNLNNIIGIL